MTQHAATIPVAGMLESDTHGKTQRVLDFNFSSRVICLLNIYVALTKYLLS
jgi:hypothetical protein